MLAAALAAAAVAVAAIALVRDDSLGARPTPPGFPDNPEGRKPVIFDVGLVSNPGAKAALTEARSLGADAIRVLVPWNLVAPIDTAAGFRSRRSRRPELQLQRLRRRRCSTIHDLGMQILLSPTGPGTRWAAKPGQRGPQRPRPGSVRALRERAGEALRRPLSTPRRRPALPKADIWTVWNEPNLSIFLQPQDRDGRPYSPLLYRQLYLAAQEAIHDQQPEAPILIGETAPTGGEQSVDPLTFTRQTLCLNGDFEELPRCPEPDEEIDAVGWSTHPYPLAGQAPFDAGHAIPIS